MRHLALCMLTALALPCAALAQQHGCSISSFEGATLPKGAVARMRVVNTATSCSILNYGAPAERKNPADSGSITKPPAHGTAEFVAPSAKYVPAAGYVGEDEFEYEAFAPGKGDKPVRLKVLVKVVVVAR